MPVWSAGFLNLTPSISRAANALLIISSSIALDSMKVNELGHLIRSQGTSISEHI